MASEPIFDALVVGAGPAGLALAAALGEQGLRVRGLAPHAPTRPWPNTYGIWEDELAPLGLTAMLGRRWTNCISYAAGRELRHARVYGLFDNARLQEHLLGRCARAGVVWTRGSAANVAHGPTVTTLQTHAGDRYLARLAIDASGHHAALIRRPPKPDVAFQAAYGIVGRFSAPPVADGQLVLMDYRADHLDGAQRSQPPTFLYAMDLGEGRYFVEETSLAYAPALTFTTLEQRLHQRLAARGVTVSAVEHVEHCIFPMNLPLPYLDQPVLGYGGAASMVHPASGFQVGAALKRADETARAVRAALDGGGGGPRQAARAGWQALWPRDRLRKRALYLFGLENVLAFDAQRIQSFFATFFDLPFPLWSGYLSDTLSSKELAQTMLTLFGRAPNPIRLALGSSIVSQYPYLWRALRGRAH